MSLIHQIIAVFLFSLNTCFISAMEAPQAAFDGDGVFASGIYFHPSRLKTVQAEIDQACYELKLSDDRDNNFRALLKTIISNNDQLQLKKMARLFQLLGNKEALKLIDTDSFPFKFRPINFKEYAEYFREADKIFKKNQELCLQEMFTTLTEHIDALYKLEKLWALLRGVKLVSLAHACAVKSTSKPAYLFAGKFFMFEELKPGYCAFTKSEGNCTAIALSIWNQTSKENPDLLLAKSRFPVDEHAFNALFNHEISFVTIIDGYSGAVTNLPLPVKFLDIQANKQLSIAHLGSLRFYPNPNSFYYSLVDDNNSSTSVAQKVFLAKEIYAELSSFLDGIQSLSAFTNAELIGFFMYVINRRLAFISPDDLWSQTDKKKIDALETDVVIGKLLPLILQDSDEKVKHYVDMIKRISETPARTFILKLIYFSANRTIS